jgi:hypothetical protein
VTGLARTPTRLPDAEVVAADALDPAAVQRAVRAADPDVIVHMLTAIPDPIDAATAILAAIEHPTARGALNVVDDQPTLVHDWLPEMAAMLGRPAPRHVPAWLARLLVVGWGVAYMTGLAGAANAHARQLLDWKPTYSSWRSGLTADLGASVRS